MGWEEVEKHCDTFWDQNLSYRRNIRRVDAEEMEVARVGYLPEVD